jgi:hypothetical protein
MIEEIVTIRVFVNLSIIILVQYQVYENHDMMINTIQLDGIVNQAINTQAIADMMIAEEIIVEVIR